MHLLPTILAPLADCCAKDSQVRFGATTGVQVSIERNDTGDTFTAVSTDGKRLVRVIGKCDLAEQYPSFPMLDAAPNGQLAAQIPGKEWTKAFRETDRLTKKIGSSKPILRNVALVCGEQVSTLAGTNLENIAFTQPRNLDGRFPNWQQVVPSKKPVYEIAVDPFLLAEVLETVGKIGTDGVTPRVVMAFQKDACHAFTIRAQMPERDTLAVVMPLSSDKKKAKLPEAEETASEREIESLRADAAELLRDMTEQRDKAIAEVERLTHINGLLRKAHDVLTAKMS